MNCCVAVKVINKIVVEKMMFEKLIDEKQKVDQDKEFNMNSDNEKRLNKEISFNCQQQNLLIDWYHCCQNSI